MAEGSSTIVKVAAWIFVLGVLVCGGGVAGAALMGGGGCLAMLGGLTALGDHLIETTPIPEPEQCAKFPADCDAAGLRPEVPRRNRDGTPIPGR
jgi:hypothetical protein